MNPQFLLSLFTVSLSLSIRRIRIFSLILALNGYIGVQYLCCPIEGKGGKGKGKKENKKHDGGGANQQAAITAAATGAKAQSNLNPLAKEWFPRQQTTPENDRSLFVTFSNGHPLYDFQIWQFFTIMFGECVEKVEMMRKGEAPLFGRIVFKNWCVPALILQNKQQAKFWVHGRPLWCKHYRPHKF